MSIHYTNLLIYSGKQWDIFLHPNQLYLGRAYLWFKGKELDLTKLNKYSYLELFTLIRRYKNVLDKLWRPVLYNYAILGNRTRHLHVHVIPRYDRPIKFAGIKFFDKNFGKPPMLTTAYDIADRVIIKIAMRLKGLCRLDLS